MNGDNESGIGSAQGVQGLQGVQAGSSEQSGNAEQTGIVVGKPEAALKPAKATKSAKVQKAEKKAGKTSHPAKGKGTKIASKGGKAPKSAMKPAVNASKATAAGKAKDGKAPKDAKPSKLDKKPASKAAKAAKTSKTSGNVPDICPFRATSSYAALWTILHAHKDGITRAALIAEGVKVTGKDAKHVGYDVAVVLSCKEDGTAHPSAAKLPADRYYVVRTGDSYKLHLR